MALRDWWHREENGRRIYAVALTASSLSKTATGKVSPAETASKDRTTVRRTGIRRRRRIRREPQGLMRRSIHRRRRRSSINPDSWSAILQYGASSLSLEFRRTNTILGVIHAAGDYGMVRKACSIRGCLWNRPELQPEHRRTITTGRSDST